MEKSGHERKRKNLSIAGAKPPSRVIAKAKVKYQKAKRTGSNNSDLK